MRLRSAAFEPFSKSFQLLKSELAEIVVGVVFVYRDWAPGMHAGNPPFSVLSVIKILQSVCIAVGMWVPKQFLATIEWPQWKDGRF